MSAATRARRLHTSVSFVLGFATPVVIWAQVSGLLEWKSLPFVAWLFPFVVAWRVFDNPPLGLYESRRAALVGRSSSASAVVSAGERLPVLKSMTGEQRRFLWHSVKAGLWSFVLLLGVGVTLGEPLPTTVWHAGLVLGAVAALVGWRVPPHSPFGAVDRSVDPLATLPEAR